MEPVARVFFVTASLTAALSLSGCGSADVLPSIGDLEGTSAKDALDSASSALDSASVALDEANQALAGAAQDIDGSFGELAGTLDGLSDVPDLLSSFFSNRELADSSSRVELVDLGSGEVLGTLDSNSDRSDRVGVGDAFAGMSVDSWKLISNIPETATADRALRFYTTSTETILGNDGGEEVEALIISMYGDTPYIEMCVKPLDLTLDFEIPQQDADALRGLL